MKVKTFWDDETIEGEITRGPTDTGLVWVQSGERLVIRHVSRVEPLDEEARELLSR